MIDASVYYCWSCDAHRRMTAMAMKEVHCPRCGAVLADEDRLATTARPLAPLPSKDVAREQLTIPA